MGRYLALRIGGSSSRSGVAVADGEAECDIMLDIIEVEVIVAVVAVAFAISVGLREMRRNLSCGVECGAGLKFIFSVKESL